MVKLLYLIVFALAGYFGWRWLRRQPRLVVMRWVVYGVVLMLVLLVATGRVHWLFAAIGALFALFLRLLPLITYFPLLQRWWRSRQEPGQSGRERDAAPAPMMDLDEAYAILGLGPQATRQEVIDAHRRLIQRLHPDRGGSGYLAAKLNQAKALLLERSDT